MIPVELIKDFLIIYYGLRLQKLAYLGARRGISLILTPQQLFSQKVDDFNLLKYM